MYEDDYTRKHFTMITWKDMMVNAQKRHRELLILLEHCSEEDKKMYESEFKNILRTHEVHKFFLINNPEMRMLMEEEFVNQAHLPKPDLDFYDKLPEEYKL